MNVFSTHSIGVITAVTLLATITNIYSSEQVELKDIKIAEADKSTPYNRADYSYGIDHDHDGQNTRTEMLQVASTSSVEFRTLKKRYVISGKWFDPYTGLTFTNANDVDIDHLVPLYEVHISGGANWSNEKKRAYANDISKDGPLRVVHRWTNRVPKNADDPSQYSPSWVPGRCQYLKDWISIKQTWGLTMDKREATNISAQLRACD